MRRFKSFLLILCALWLPLQAATAVAMPFCSHAGEPAAQVEAAQASDHCQSKAAQLASPLPATWVATTAACAT
jgi:hypothetical protein